MAVSSKAGGSLLNSAVSLARAGIRAELITEYGKDKAGNIIDDFLLENKVGTSYIARYGSGKTAIALAFLDDTRDADYSFYKQYPRKRLDLQLPVPGEEDIVLFGSSYSVSDVVHKTIHQWVKKARNNKALIIYDPNFRKPHLSEIEKVRPRILDNIHLSHIVRGSDQDFLNIFAIADPFEVIRYLRQNECRNLIMTRNKETVLAWFGNLSSTFRVTDVQPMVSTIGAGDAFNAGIVFSIVHDGIYPSDLVDLSQLKAERMIRTGIGFAAEVCRSPENYIPVDFGNRLKNEPLDH
jgi:fructokinase